jgi:hypothetical protein
MVVLLCDVMIAATSVGGTFGGPASSTGSGGKCASSYELGLRWHGLRWGFEHGAVRMNDGEMELLHRHGPTPEGDRTITG